MCFYCFFCKQKTAYEMRISDWSSDVCSSDLAKVTGKKIPEQIDKERRRLVDAMIDSHKYNAEGRSAIYGEPEMVYATTKLCLENGIQPVVVACGRGGNKLTALLAAEMEDCLEDVLVLSESALADIRGISAMKNADRKSVV